MTDSRVKIIVDTTPMGEGPTHRDEVTYPDYPSARAAYRTIWNIFRGNHRVWNFARDYEVDARMILGFVVENPSPSTFETKVIMVKAD